LWRNKTDIDNSDLSQVSVLRAIRYQYDWLPMNQSQWYRKHVKCLDKKSKLLCELDKTMSDLNIPPGERLSQEEADSFMPGFGRDITTGEMYDWGVLTSYENYVTEWHKIVRQVVGPKGDAKCPSRPHRNKVLEDLHHDIDTDSYVVHPTTLSLYNSVNNIGRLMSVLPMTYRTLQDLSFALKIVHDELSDKEDAELRKRHVSIKELMSKNAELLCELDFAMNRNNIEFSRIDQLTLSQKIAVDYDDFSYTRIKHNHILKEYRSFIKHVSLQILKLV
ncbi:unnamed protein product, partial [Nesidiocoris tenuis]